MGIQDIEQMGVMMKLILVGRLEYRKVMTFPTVVPKPKELDVL